MKKIITVIIGISICSAAFAKELSEIISPSVYVIVAAGDSSEDPEDLALGSHDPSRELTVQGIETDISIRLNENIEGFVHLLLAYGAEEEWEDELEEAFAKLTKLPGNTEIRGGRFLNRFGLHNAKHAHGWNSVDVPLVVGRFLGEGGLVTEGADFTWYLPTAWTSALTVSYGEALAHDHGHGSEEEEEAEFEEALFEDEFVSVNVLTKYNYNDFHRTQAGFTYATGDNGLGDTTDIFGVNFTYIWRENGLRPGGKSLTWNTEVFSRHIDEGEGHGHEDEHGHEEEEHEDEAGHNDEEEGQGDFEELGFYTELIYGFDERLDAGLRVGSVEGIKELGAEERVRVSPNVRYKVLKDRPVYLRLQYNYDDLEDDEAHSFWAQIQAGFGSGGGVR